MASVVTENLLITSKELLGGRENRLRGLEELKEEFLFSFLWFSHLSFRAEKLTDLRICRKNVTILMSQDRLKNSSS